MEFLDTSDLRDEKIVLYKVRTANENKERGWVPAYYFDIYLTDGTKIGYCDLRVGHNEETHIGGNIGYGIEKDYRGNGYAARAVELLKVLAKKHNMEYLIIACKPDNIASYKTIEKSGGKFLELKEIPEGHELRTITGEYEKIYRIDL